MKMCVPDWYPILVETVADSNCMTYYRDTGIAEIWESGGRNQVGYLNMVDDSGPASRSSLSWDVRGKGDDRKHEAERSGGDQFAQVKGAYGLL